MKARKEKMSGLVAESLSLEQAIKENLRGLGYGG